VQGDPTRVRREDSSPKYQANPFVAAADRYGTRTTDAHQQWWPRNSAGDGHRHAAVVGRVRNGSEAVGGPARGKCASSQEVLPSGSKAVWGVGHRWPE
jgi:hypothetical protein